MKRVADAAVIASTEANVVEPWCEGRLTGSGAEGNAIGNGVLKCLSLRFKTPTKVKCLQEYLILQACTRQEKPMQPYYCLLFNLLATV